MILQNVHDYDAILPHEDKQCRVLLELSADTIQIQFKTLQLHTVWKGTSKLPFLNSRVFDN